MPTGYSSGEYNALYTAYSSNDASFKEALSTPLSGYFKNGEAYNQGNYGYFWSSTFYSSGGMYTWAFIRGYSSSSHGLCDVGNSIRCLFDP